jgi:membrane protein YdbS with pleckstrin-like domain
MLTPAEQGFMAYWQQQRTNKKKYLSKWSLGLPAGAVIVAAILINFLSGWYKRADMQLRADGSVIITVLIAALGIVIFMVYFSVRYKWEQNEQHYQELLLKQESAQQNGAV